MHLACVLISLTGSSCIFLSFPDPDMFDDPEMKAEDLRLRKRTFRGRDFMLKKTIAVLLHLRRMHEELQLTAHGASVSASTPSHRRQSTSGRTTVDSSQVAIMDYDDDDESRTLTLSTDDQQLVQRASNAANRSWHFRMFANSGEARYLCLLSPSVDDHRIVDGNTLWCEQSARPRNELIGRRVQEIFAPATWQRYRAGIPSMIKYRAWIIRNAPVYSVQSTGDVLTWVEYDDGSSDVGSAAAYAAGGHDDNTSRAIEPVNPFRVPKYLHSISLNLRPWAKKPAWSVSSASSSASLTFDSSSNLHFDASSSTAFAPYAPPQIQYAVMVALTTAHSPGELLGVFPWAEDGSDMSNGNAPISTMTRSELVRTIPQARALLASESIGASSAPPEPVVEPTKDLFEQLDGFFSVPQPEDISPASAMSAASVVTDDYSPMVHYHTASQSAWSDQFTQ